MTGHELIAVQSDHYRQLRYVCECGDVGLAVPTRGAAAADHGRHVRAKELAASLAEKSEAPRP